MIFIGRSDRGYRALKATPRIYFYTISLWATSLPLGKRLITDSYLGKNLRQNSLTLFSLKWLEKLIEHYICEKALNGRMDEWNSNQHQKLGTKAKLCLLISVAKKLKDSSTHSVLLQNLQLIVFRIYIFRTTSIIIDFEFPILSTLTLPTSYEYINNIKSRRCRSAELHKNTSVRWNVVRFQFSESITSASLKLRNC